MYLFFLTGLDSFTCKDLHCVNFQPNVSPHPHSPEALEPLSWSGSSPAPPPAGRAGWSWWSRKWLHLSYLRPPQRKAWKTREQYSEKKTTNSALFAPALQIYSCGCVSAQIFQSCWSKTVNITLWLWTIQGCQNEHFFTGSIRGKEECWLTPRGICSITILFLSNPFVSWAEEQIANSGCLTLL